MQDKKTKSSIKYPIAIAITTISILLLIATAIFAEHSLGLTSLILLIFLTIIIIWTTYFRERNLLYRLKLAENDPHTIVENFIKTLAKPSTKYYQTMLPQELYIKAIKELAKKGTPLERTRAVLNEIKLPPGGSTDAIYEAIRQLDPTHLKLLLKEGNTDTNSIDCCGFSLLHTIVNQFSEVKRNTSSRTNNTKAEDFIDVIRVLISNEVNRKAKNPPFDNKTALEMFNDCPCNPAFNPPQITEIANLLDPNIPIKELNLEIKRATEDKPKLPIPIEEIETPKDTPDGDKPETPNEEGNETHTKP